MACTDGWFTMAELEHLAVSAPSGRQAAASWGQEYMWEINNWLGQRAGALNPCVWQQVPPGLTRAAVLACVQDLVVRNETLRTCFVGWGAGALTQVVEGELDIPVSAFQVHQVPESYADVALDAVVRASRSWLFDITKPPLLRVVVVETEGRPDFVALVVSHLLLDGYSCWLVSQQLADLLGQELSPGDPDARPVRLQPADQAEFEVSNDGRRRNSASMHYWDRTLREFPVTLPGDGRFPAEEPRYRHGELRTQRGFDAARQLSRDLNVSLPMVFTGALAAVLGEGTGLERYPLLARVSNRQFLLDQEMVGHFAQGVPVLLDLTHDDVADYLRAVQRTVLRSMSYGYFSQASLGVLLERLARERDCSVPMRVTVNHLPLWSRSTEAQVVPDELPSTFEWIGEADQENLAVYATVEEEIEAVALYVDTAFLPSARVEATLRRIERFVLLAASGERRMSSAMA